MHEGDGDEEMVRAVSNGTRFRVPSHARSLAHPPSQHSPDFLLFRHLHYIVIIPNPWTFNFVRSTPLVVTRRSLFSPLATTITPHLPP